MSFSDFHPFLISLTIGLILGIERERSHPRGTQAAGVRTFMLFGLLGTVAAFLDNPFLTAGITAFVAGLVLLGYWRTPAQKFDYGLTTEVAAIVTFGLGFMAQTEPILTLTLGILVFAVLFFRPWLHRFSHEILQPTEIRAALTLALMTVGIVPFLPDHAVDPWNLVNPRKLASVIAALGIVQFASYVAVRALGPKAGTMLSGFFGGLISSTSVFATLPQRVRRKPELFFPVLAALLLAVLAMLLEALMILAMTAPGLLGTVGVPIVVMGVLCLVLAIGLGPRARVEPNDGWKSTNPLDVRAVLKMSALIFVMLLVIAVINRVLGAEASKWAAFLGGLFELHGATFATASLLAQEQLSLEAASSTLGLTISAAFVSKFFLLWLLERGRFSVWASICLLGILAGGAATFGLTSIWR